MSVMPPTCGVVIEKSGEIERICPEFAVDQVTMVDPGDQTRVSAILLVCPKHSSDLDQGKELIFVSAANGDRIAVQFKIDKKEE